MKGGSAKSSSLHFITEGYAQAGPTDRRVDGSSLRQQQDGAELRGRAVMYRCAHRAIAIAAAFLGATVTAEQHRGRAQQARQGQA